MVDLDQLERPRRTERPGNRLGALFDLGFAASSRALLEVDALQAGADRSPMRNAQVRLDAFLPTLRTNSETLGLFGVRKTALMVVRMISSRSSSSTL